MKLRLTLAPLALSLFAFSCGDDADGGGGKVRLLLTAEETITEGLDQGDDVENTRDYAVRYTKYLAVLGDVSLGRSGEKKELAGPFIVDMTQVGEAGIELGTFDGLEAGEWPEFGFRTPAAGSSALALGAVSDADRKVMVDGGLTYWIEGQVERADAEGGAVKFVVQVETDTVFSDCEYDGEPGVTVVADGTATATMTLHGDHMFFNAFPTGSEGTSERLAGWMLASDLNEDGEVTTAELAQVDATDVFTREAGYSLDGSPIPITTALDFVRAQLATQGHYRGEGECIWMFEGATGD